MLPAKKLYLPLLIVEFYLIFTVWLLYFGPIVWPLENESKFLTLIVVYHLFFIFGYALSIFLFSKKNNVLSEKQTVTSNSLKIEDYVLKNYWVIVALAFVGSIIFHRNLTHASSYIPWDFFSKFYEGVVDPIKARTFYASSDYALNFPGNKYVTSLLLFISIFKYSMLPMLFFLWKRLSPVRKAVGILVLIIPLISGISLSLSVINFHYLFVLSICFIFLALTNTVKTFLSELKQRKFLLISFVFLFFFSFWYFYNVKSEATPYQVITGKQAPISLNYLKQYNIKFKSDDLHDTSSGPNKPIYIDFYEKITTYLVQGYFGMSIALGEKFQTSFGVGHSVFLQRVFDKHLGFDIATRSFQHKTKRWDGSVFWHSAYTDFANDVSFPGVSLVMFILGFYLAKVFAWAVVFDNFIAKLLLPIFAILFLYMPANNQVFSFLELMSSFWILTILFLTFTHKQSSNTTRP